MMEVGSGQGRRGVRAPTPVLYLILREGVGVDAGVGRAYGIRDFWIFQGLLKGFW